MRKSILFLILFTCILFAAGGIEAKGADFNLVLHAGQISLLDRTGNRMPAVSGQFISSTKFSSIEIGDNSAVFLQREGQLYQIRSAGIVPLEKIGQQSSVPYRKAIQFLKGLVTPRRFIKQTRVRGDPKPPIEDDSSFFEWQWQQIVQESTDGTSQFSADTLLAVAAWYEQKGNQARVAYILERLNTTGQQRNEFYQQLRQESFRGTTLADINQEVDNTKRRIASTVAPLHYKALLIGIDDYQNPYWQKLENPVRDIRRLRDILISDYGLKPDDIILLENPAFDEIISAFQSLKQSIDSKTSLLIYYAGHGYYPPEEKEGYWIPRDAGKPESLRLFLSTSTVLSKVNAIKSRHTLLIADSCFSGSLIRKTRSAVVNSRYYSELSQKKSRQIITSGGLEPVSDRGGEGHSLFARQLIDILSEKQREPLSASELALKLRKAVKNAQYEQTPEYGRLHIADDEAGEFFFVRKDLHFASVSTDMPREKSGDEKTDVDSKETKRSDDEYFRLNIKLPKSDPFQIEGGTVIVQGGLIFHRGNLQYNLPFQNPDTQKTDTVKAVSSIDGYGVRGELRKSADKTGYGVQITLGQFLQMSTCAEDNTYETYDGIPACSGENVANAAGSLNQNLSMSGQILQLGVFADYSPISRRFFSAQVGIELQYQLYQLNNFLGLDTAHSNSLSVCGTFGLSFRYDPWTARLIGGICTPPVLSSGSLYEIDNDDGSDVRLANYGNFGLSFVYEFNTQ